MTRLKIRKDALKRPAQILDYFAYNIEELLTQLSSGFGYIVVSFSVLSFSVSDRGRYMTKTSLTLIISFTSMQSLAF